MLYATTYSRRRLEYRRHDFFDTSSALMKRLLFLTIYLLATEERMHRIALCFSCSSGAAAFYFYISRAHC